MSKQSSIEWLVNQYQMKGYIGVQDELQAKAMHKEEIIDSYCHGCLDMTNDDTIFPRETSEQYYTKIFGGQDNERNRSIPE